MAKSDPTINGITKYLRSGYSKQEDLDLSVELDERKSRVTFKYLEVKSALLKLKTTDPDLHCKLGYLWQTARSRNDIANSLYMDSSTLRRKWIRALDILLNYLINSDTIADLEPIDLLYKEYKERGLLLSA